MIAGAAILAAMKDQPSNAVGKSRTGPALGRMVAACVGVVLLTALVEACMGRHFFSASGKILLWVNSTTSPETSQQFLDWYSITHVLHGMIMYGMIRWLGSWRKGGLALGTVLLLTVAIESAWEIAENSPLVINRYREATIALGYTGDTILNSMMDIACCMLGCVLAWRMPTWLTVSLAVSSEIVLALLIRDNLTLNVLMLLCPIDAVKHWQMGG